MIKTEIRNPQKGTCSTAETITSVQEHLQSLSEIFGKNPYQLSGQFRRCQTGIQELSRIFGVLQSEEASSRGGLSTSSARVETEIAKCISECLSSFDGQNQDIPHILSLLKSYKVVRPLPYGRCSVSLLQIHLILQDNFEDSCLCKLLNIILGCHSNVVTKTIQF